MDLSDEELKQPLVAAATTGAPSPAPMGVAPARSPTRAPPRQMQRNPALEGVEEEKDDAVKPPRGPQKPLPYAAPNVHPYAVPQYQPSGYGGNGSGWGMSGQDQPYEVGGGQAATIDIVFSGMYTLAAALTVIQGFGMLIHFTYASIALGFYTMAFGAGVIMYDLKSVVNGVSVEMYLPFLGNYIGRALTILFFAVLCAQTYEYEGWTRMIVLYNLLVAVLQGFVYFTTMTVAPSQPHLDDDLPDI